MRAAVPLAAALKLPVVATHPVQFATPDDFEAHEARVCVSEGETLTNPRRVKRFSREQYFKTQAQMEALFADIPSAVRNTLEIARRCNLSLTLGKPQLPDFPTPEVNGVRMPMEDFDMAEEKQSENRDKASSAAGGTAGTGERDVLPGAGASLGAAGVGTGSADDTGGLTESAAGESARGGGDARANRLGSHDEDGRASGAGAGGAGSATGDASAGRSEGGGGNGLGGVDAGSPGGMGGVGVAGGTGTDRPPGGVSPVQNGDRD